MELICKITVFNNDGVRTTDQQKSSSALLSFAGRQSSGKQSPWRQN